LLIVGEMVHTELQVEALGRDQARVEAMRARNEERRERFLNARQRSIGIDVDSLDQQCAEKKTAKADGASEDMEYAQRMAYITQLVEQREAQETAIKKAEHSVLQGVWDEQKSRPKNDCKKMADPVNVDACGLAAVQKFDGEDRSRGSRVNLQKAQMRSWTTQQIGEKASRKNDDADEDHRYAEYLKTVQEARDSLEAEEGSERRRQTVQMKDDNQALAAEIVAKQAAAKQANAHADAKELAAMYDNIVLNEGTSIMTSALGEQRIRGDHFKGFSKEQTLQVYHENAMVLEEKRAIKASEGEDDRAFVAQHEELRKLVEETEYSQKQDHRQILAEHSKYLEMQREEQAKLRATEKKESKGHIGPGLMDGFGCSWR